MDIVLPLLIFLPLSTLVLWYGCRSVEPVERAWLSNILFLALGARLLVATVLALVPSLRVFHEDADGYETYGMAIAASWKGQGPPIGRLPVQNFGYFYVSAAVYYVFGAYRVCASYSNALIGTITTLLLYKLSRKFFHQLVARRATLFIAFFPSMILWSALAIKDPLMSLLIVLCMSSCVSLKKRFSLGALFGVIVPILAMQPIRFYMVYFIGFSVLLSMGIERGMSFVSGVYKQIFTATIALGLLTIIGLSGSAQSGVQDLTFKRASSFRQGMATSADSGFQSNADVSTPIRALMFLPTGVTVLLFGPFPWQFTSGRSLLAAPETLAWWIMFPSCLRGFRFAVRRRFSQTSPVLIFTITMTCGYGIVQGNIGSAFRQRAQIFILLFIFTALGSYVKKCRAAGISDERLLSS
jgi:hypothetical protein